MTKRSKRQQRIKKGSIIPTQDEVPESSVGCGIEKEPSLIPPKIFRSLLNLSLRLLPEERGVILSITTHITDFKTYILFCLSFLNNCFVQPIGIFRVDSEQGINFEDLIEYWINYIQDISLLNLRVIASISNPLGYYFDAVKVLMKCQIIWGQINALIYCIMPYKEIVHLFCTQSTMSQLYNTFQRKPNLYYISADVFADGERFKMVHSCYLDVTQIAQLANIKDPNSMSDDSFEAALEKWKIINRPNDTNVTYNVITMLGKFTEMVIKPRNLTREQIQQILTKNHDLFRMLLSAKFLPYEIDKLPEYSGPEFNLYDPYFELVKSRLMNHSLENNHPVEPYYLLKEEAVPHFTKPSACLGKRTKSDKRRLVKVLKRHWSNHNLHKLETKPEHVPHRVEIGNDFMVHLNIRGDSRSFDENIEYIKTLVDEIIESALSNNKAEPDSLLLDQPWTNVFNHKPNLVDLMNNRQGNTSMTVVKNIKQKPEQMRYEIARSIAEELVNNVFVVADGTTNIISTKEMEIWKQNWERKQFNSLFNKLCALTQTDAPVTYLLYDFMGINKLGEILHRYQVKTIDSDILCIDRARASMQYLHSKNLSAFHTDRFHLVDSKATLEELTGSE